MDAIVTNRTETPAIPPCCAHMAVEWQCDAQPAPFQATAPIRRPFTHPPSPAGVADEGAQQAPRPAPPLRPVAYGMAAATGLLAFYLGLITLAQGWSHATAQL